MNFLFKLVLSVLIFGALTSCATMSPSAQATFDGVIKNAIWGKIVDLPEGRAAYVDLRTLQISNGKVVGWFQISSLEMISIDCYARTYSAKVFLYNLVDAVTNSPIDSTVQNSVIRLASEKLCDRWIPPLNAFSRYIASDNEKGWYFFPYLTYRPTDKNVVVTRLYLSSPPGAPPATPSQDSYFFVFETNCSNSAFRISALSQKWAELSELDEDVPWSSPGSNLVVSAMTRQLCAILGLPNKPSVPLRPRTPPNRMNENSDHPAVRCIARGLKPGTVDFSKCVANQ